MKTHERLARIRENAERMRLARERTAPKKTSLFMAEHLPNTRGRVKPTRTSLDAVTAIFLK